MSAPSDPSEPRTNRTNPVEVYMAAFDRCTRRDLVDLSTALFSIRYPFGMSYGEHTKNHQALRRAVRRGDVESVKVIIAKNALDGAPFAREVGEPLLVELATIHRDSIISVAKEKGVDICEVQHEIERTEDASAEVPNEDAAAYCYTDALDAAAPKASSAP